MNNEDELENIIRNKEFAALTEEERALVLRTIGSEEEYEAIRKIELAVSSGGHRSTLEPRPEILDALQHRMKKQRTPFEWENIFQFKIPAYAAVLGVLIISVMIFALRPTATVNLVSREKIDAPVPRIDTVFITKIDTVVHERIVYRQVNQTNQLRPVVKLDPATLVHQKQATGSGVSMKEKEELNKLLVSGSD